MTEQPASQSGESSAAASDLPEKEEASDARAGKSYRLSPGKRWAFRLTAAGIPLLVGAVVVVYLLFQRHMLFFDPFTGRLSWQGPRIYVQEPGFEKTGHKYLYDDQLGWRNIPDWEATTLGKPLRINSLGLRDDECAPAKPAGVRRILVLGDSYTWGYGVGNGETYCDVLQDRLNQQGGKWEVLNSGVSGWGTDQEFLYLQQEGFLFDPDIVVLGFFVVNDPANNIYSKQYGLHKPLFLDTNLKLVNVPVPRPDDPDPQLVSQADPLQLTQAILVRMAQLCRQQGCPLVVMKFGEFYEADVPAFQLVSRQVRRSLIGASGVSYLDLDREFQVRQLSTQSLIEGNDDGHWNAFGHEQTAEILLETLIDQGIVRTP